MGICKSWLIISSARNLVSQSLALLAPAIGILFFLFSSSPLTSHPAIISCYKEKKKFHLYISALVLWTVPWCQQDSCYLWWHTICVRAIYMKNCPYHKRRPAAGNSKPPGVHSGLTSLPVNHRHSQKSVIQKRHQKSVIHKHHQWFLFLRGN